MVKFTLDAIEVAKTKFENSDIEMAEVKSRLTSIYEQPFMSQFTDETERQMAAIRILKAQVMAQVEKSSFSNAETILVQIEGKEEITAFKRQDGTESYRSSLYVIAQYKEEPRFAQITLWGDANEMNPNLIIGKSYMMPVIVGGNDPLIMSVNDPVELEVVENNFPLLAEVIKADYTPIDIREMEFNISRDYNDNKLVKGTVLSSWMKVTKNDKNMGFLKMVGDDESEITVIKFSRSADQVIMYGVGSMVYVYGQVTDAVLDNDGIEQYPVGMWGNLIVPMLVIPPEMTDTPGIELSETPIQKSNGSTNGFNEKDISGW